MDVVIIIKVLFERTDSSSIIIFMVKHEVYIYISSIIRWIMIKELGLEIMRFLEGDLYSKHKKKID